MSLLLRNCRRTTERIRLCNQNETINGDKPPECLVVCLVAPTSTLHQETARSKTAALQCRPSVRPSDVAFVQGPGVSELISPELHQQGQNAPCIDWLGRVATSPPPGCSIVQELLGFGQKLQLTPVPHV